MTSRTVQTISGQTGAGKRITIIAVAATLGLWALGAHGERSDSPPTATGETSASVSCIQEAAGFSLNCTANDVSIAGVAADQYGDRIWITDPCQKPGDSVTFIAEFAVELNAQDRHDIGIYFATDGDQSGDGALTSDNTNLQNGCSVTVLEHEGSKWVDLDGTADPYPGEKKPSGVQDTCGDIDDAHSPLYPAIEVTAVCVDSDGDGFLNLPNCVSWRQSGANELCTDPTDTFPGAPSKCKCDTGFNVPVPVPADVSFAKEVRVAGTLTSFGESVTFDEAGGFAEYRVTYSFPTSSRTEDVTISALVDDVYGDITSVHGDITATDCSVSQVLKGDGSDGKSGTYSCTFTTKVSGNPRTIIDTVKATASDAVGNDLTRTDTASVVIENSPPVIVVTKTASPRECLEPGCNVTFTVKIKNDSEKPDPVTINALVDEIDGTTVGLSGQGTCATGQVINAGDTWTCSFSYFVSGNAGDTQKDTVTATGTDDEGNPASDSGTATVDIKNVLGGISVTKTASRTSCAEPGCDVTFTVTIRNLSSVDTVTIDTLTDDVGKGPGALTDCFTLPLFIGKGGSATCTFTRSLEGNAGDRHTDTVTASGTDDDGDPVGPASDSADVNFTDVPPAASLSKSVESMVVTYKVVVSNDSDAEDLYLSELKDDMFCDITSSHYASGGCGEVTATTCQDNHWIAAGGEYQCTFDGVVTSSPHTNTVTGTLDDDDEPAAPVTPSDSATVSFSN